MTEPYVPATPGDPILASKWNSLQVTVRDKIEALEANKLNIAGGSVGGPLSVTGPLKLTTQLTVGLGNDAPLAAADVREALVVSGPNATGLRITTKFATFPDNAPNRAEIAVDPSYQTLMIVGSRTGALANPELAWPSLGRRVSVWDRLEVNGHTLSQTVSVGHFPTTRPLQTLHVAGRVAVDQGVIQHGGPAITETADLGLYSQVQDNWIRVVTRNGLVRFFADGGIGTTSNLDVLPYGDLKVRRYVSAGGLAVGAGIDQPSDLIHLFGAAGNLAIRMQTGNGPADFIGVRYFHGNTERNWAGSFGATGRWSVNHVFNVMNGRVGIGPGTDSAIDTTLDVHGDLQVARPGTTMGLTVNTSFTGYSNDVRDRAEISVDPANKTLMIVGSVAAAVDDPANMKWPALGRRVSVWDRLEVNGHLLATTQAIGAAATLRPLHALHVGGRMYLEGGVIQRGGATAITDTSDLGLYSQYPGNLIRIVTKDGGVTFRSDGGSGTTANVDILPTGDLKVRRNTITAALGVGASVDPPQDLVHIAAPTGNIGLRIQTGAAASDVTAIRFYNGNTQTAFITTQNDGRFSVSHTLNVAGGKVGINGAGGVATLPLGPLHVQNGNGGLLFNFGHTGYSNGTRDRAEISLDGGTYKTLMLVGSVSNAIDDPANWQWPSLGRRVSVWDRLEVNGHLYSNTAVISTSVGAATKPVQDLHVHGRVYIEHGVIQRGGAAITGTADLGLYSQVAGNWMRFVTNGGQFSYFADSGTGTNQIARLDPSGNMWFRGRLFPDGGVNGLISDRRVKTDIRPLESSLAKLLEVRGVRFRWLDPTRGEGDQIGLIAQEVEAVFPELVTQLADGHKRLDYIGLIAPLVDAVREQQQQIAGLRRELADLRERIA